MTKFPIVIGHSGLDVTGDANRDDIKSTSVKVLLGDKGGDRRACYTECICMPRLYAGSGFAASTISAQAAKKLLAGAGDHLCR